MLQMSPQRFRSGSKWTISAGSGSLGLIVEQDPHRRGAAAEDDELNPSVMYNGPIRERVCEPQRGMSLQHGRCLDRKSRLKANIGSIALIPV